MTLKCGVPITLDTWLGWPLRIAHFAGKGRTEGVVSAHDSLLVWSGGKSEVTLQECAPQKGERHQFIRHAGTVDLMPKGTILDEVSWQGQACTCVAVTFDARTVERALGRTAVLDPQRVRVALPDAHVVELVYRLQEQVRAGQPWGSLYVEALSLTLASYVYGRYGTRVTPVEEEPPRPA